MTLYGSVVDVMIAQAERRCGEMERLLSCPDEKAANNGTVATQVSDRLLALGSHGALRNLAHLLDWRGGYALRAHRVARRLVALADKPAVAHSIAHRNPAEICRSGTPR